MMRSLLMIGALLAILVSGALEGASLVAQIDTSSIAQESVGAVMEPAPAPVAAPEGPLLPRSMRPFYHLFASFALSWLLILAYAVSVRRRMAQLEEELQRLAR